MKTSLDCLISAVDFNPIKSYGVRGPLRCQATPNDLYATTQTLPYLSGLGLDKRFCCFR
jgi:hypothetical protein